MGLEAINRLEYEQAGYALVRSVIPLAALQRAKAEILNVGNVLLEGAFTDLDIMYSAAKTSRPEAAGLIYDACKRMVSLTSIAQGDGLIGALRAVGCRYPASIDVNIRVDSKSKEKYLFDWHQDYWFSMASKNGIVVWIPITDVSEEIGGLELISGEITGRKIFDVLPGEAFNSYADAIKLNEVIPVDKAFPIRVKAGDALFFRFDVLHKSLPVLSDSASRWTIQARFADFDDSEFRERKFRAASVSKGGVPYLDELRRLAVGRDVRA